MFSSLLARHVPLTTGILGHCLQDFQQEKKIAKLFGCRHTMNAISQSPPGDPVLPARLFVEGLSFRTGLGIFLLTKGGIPGAGGAS
jgi:hypothetical protein